MSKCSIYVENQFGPSVDGSCYHGFDFTLLFEEGFFSIAPSSAFILAALLQLLYLKNEPTKVRGGYIHILKLVHIEQKLVPYTETDTAKYRFSMLFILFSNWSLWHYGLARRLQGLI
jgi:hypothetical protein